jgi:hypothetical protein
MALRRDPYEFCFPKKKKNGEWETKEEMIKRVDKERKDYDIKEYKSNIKRIMNAGFNEKQAKYLYELEQKRGKAGRSWRDAVY